MQNLTGIKIPDPTYYHLSFMDTSSRKFLGDG